jgi:hypothetical protein
MAVKDTKEKKRRQHDPAADNLLLRSICNIFDESIAECLKVLQMNSFARFRTSSVYRLLLASLKHSGTGSTGTAATGNGHGEARAFMDSPISQVGGQPSEVEMDVMRSMASDHLSLIALPPPSSMGTHNINNHTNVLRINPPISHGLSHELKSAIHHHGHGSSGHHRTTESLSAQAHHNHLAPHRSNSLAGRASAWNDTSSGVASPAATSVPSLGSPILTTHHSSGAPTTPTGTATTTVTSPTTHNNNSNNNNFQFLFDTQPIFRVF